MTLRRILPDTNACYPISLLDLMLRLDEASLHEIIWTEDLLVELEDTWVGQGIRTREDARRVCDDIRTAFVGQDVPRSEYEHLINEMPGSDPDDHVHAAAAVARAPTTIITENVRDFPSEPLAALGVRVCRPDEYLSEVFEEEPDEVIRIVGNMAADRHRPPMTVANVLSAIERAGATGFAGLVRLRLDT